MPVGTALRNLSIHIQRSPLPRTGYLWGSEFAVSGIVSWLIPGSIGTGETVMLKK